MSKDIIVLTPNGRRQKIHCTPDTIILQVSTYLFTFNGLYGHVYLPNHKFKPYKCIGSICFGQMQMLTIHQNM